MSSPVADYTAQRIAVISAASLLFGLFVSQIVRDRVEMLAGRSFWRTKRVIRFSGALAAAALVALHVDSHGAFGIYGVPAVVALSSLLSWILIATFCLTTHRAIVASFPFTFHNSLVAERRLLWATWLYGITACTMFTLNQVITDRVWHVWYNGFLLAMAASLLGAVLLTYEKLRQQLASVQVNQAQRATRKSPPTEDLVRTVQRWRVFSMFTVFVFLLFAVLLCNSLYLGVARLALPPPALEDAVLRDPSRRLGVADWVWPFVVVLLLGVELWYSWRGRPQRVFGEAAHVTEVERTTFSMKRVETLTRARASVSAAEEGDEDDVEDPKPKPKPKGDEDDDSGDAILSGIPSLSVVEIQQCRNHASRQFTPTEANSFY